MQEAARFAAARALQEFIFLAGLAMLMRSSTEALVAGAASVEPLAATSPPSLEVPTPKWAADKTGSGSDTANALQRDLDDGANGEITSDGRESEIAVADIGAGFAVQKMNNGVSKTLKKRAARGEGADSAPAGDGWKSKESVGARGNGKGGKRAAIGVGARGDGKVGKGAAASDRGKGKDSMPGPPMDAGQRYFKKHLCRFFEQGWCSKEQSCTFAHGAHELRP